VLFRSWFGTLFAISACDTNCADLGFLKRKNQVPRRNFTHCIVKVISVTTRLVLWRPKVAARLFLAESFVLIDPPESHLFGFLTAPTCLFFHYLLSIIELSKYLLWLNTEYLVYLITIWSSNKSDQHRLTWAHR